MGNTTTPQYSIMTRSIDTQVAGKHDDMREFAIPFNGDQSLLTKIEEISLLERVREVYGADGNLYPVDLCPAYLLNTISMQNSALSFRNC